MELLLKGLVFDDRFALLFEEHAVGPPACSKRRARSHQDPSQRLQAPPTGLFGASGSLTFFTCPSLLLPAISCRTPRRSQKPPGPSRTSRGPKERCSQNRISNVGEAEMASSPPTTPTTQQQSEDGRGQGGAGGPVLIDISVLLRLGRRSRPHCLRKSVAAYPHSVANVHP